MWVWLTRFERERWALRSCVCSYVLARSHLYTLLVELTHGPHLSVCMDRRWNKINCFSKHSMANSNQISRHFHNGFKNFHRHQMSSNSTLRLHKSTLAPLLLYPVSEESFIMPYSMKFLSPPISVRGKNPFRSIKRLRYLCQHHYVAYTANELKQSECNHPII